MSSTTVSEDRVWQMRNIESANGCVKPKTVLDIGYPDGMDALLTLWDGEVETVDPFVDKATYVMRFEDMEDRKYDLVNMSSVLDYFDDPMAALRKARSMGQWILLQGRLSSYNSDWFSAKYWCPTKNWVNEKAAEAMGMTDVRWIRFRENNMFSIFGKVEQ